MQPACDCAKTKKGTQLSSFFVIPTGFKPVTF